MNQPTPLPWRERPLLSMAETAELLGVGRTSLENLWRSGEIRTKKIGNRRMVVTSSILEWLGEELPARPGASTASPSAPKIRRNVAHLRRKVLS